MPTNPPPAIKGEGNVSNWTTEEVESIQGIPEWYEDDHNEEEYSENAAPPAIRAAGNVSNYPSGSKGISKPSNATYDYNNPTSPATQIASMNKMIQELQVELARLQNGRAGFGTTDAYLSPASGRKFFLRPLIDVEQKGKVEEWISGQLEKSAITKAGTNVIDFLNQLAKGVGLTDEQTSKIGKKILSTGASAATFAATGNFPIAAMAYFAIDRAFDSAVQRAVFNGSEIEEANLDGMPLLKYGLEIPSGLPNDVFDDYRFVCFDRVTGKFWPSDEVQPLSYQGNDFRWLCLDRISAKVYQCNMIKRPRIYLD